VALAAWLSVAMLAVALAGQILGNDAVVTWASGALVAILPLATGAAILRYRLYDLDRIISRTLAYGLLTLLLAGGYAVVVLGLGQLIGRRQSSLAVAAATLVVAALFQPARRRVQAAVDRRFNRRRHDAARMIDAFGTRLRDQVDLTTLSAEILTVVDQTMAPTRGLAGYITGDTERSIPGGGQLVGAAPSVSSLMSARTTAAPASARAWAVASPIPELAPVTRATWPVKS
jgi:hypothetical protein